MYRLVHKLTALLLFLGLVSGSLYAREPDRCKGKQIKAEVLSNRQRAGGSSSPYEFIPQSYTAAPQGYTPFYISHFGRHGSRYHTSAGTFSSLLKTLTEAAENDLLTACGKDLLQRMESASEITQRLSGDLSQVGTREHKEIAARMYSNFPEVFSTNGRTCRIYARATTSPRVILSMAAFSEALKEIDKSIEITREAGNETSSYLNHYTPEYKQYYSEGPWRQIRDEWAKKHIDPSRIINSLFKDASPVGGKADGSRARRFVQDLFSAAAIMPASGLPSLYDFFNDDEILVLWQAKNMDQYMQKGPSGIGHDLALDIARPLLKNFIDSAEAALSGNGISADLRFGHGEGLMPLAGLMGIEEAARVESNPDKMYIAWQDYKITSMAGNIQWIFFTNGSNDILVKILLNERESRIPVATDSWPYYHWKDIHNYYKTLLNL